MPEQVADTELPAEPPSESISRDQPYVLPKFLQFEKKIWFWIDRTCRVSEFLSIKKKQCMTFM